MSDLIRRSEVLDLLYVIFNRYRISTDKTHSICHSFGDEVFEEIRNMPTAYDIDKVVEELKELRKKDVCDYLDCDVCLYTDKCSAETDQSNNIKWDKAIEIVKQGISDDVCEWIKYDYRTICPKNHDANNPYWRIPDNMDKLKYCPYCGKKIKVIGGGVNDD